MIFFYKMCAVKVRNAKLRNYLKVAPYSFDCTAHNCIQKTIILSSCKV
jgi:hypothetical protein